MTLISPATFAKLRTVFKEVTDTFGQKAIVYKLKGTSLSRFNQDRAGDGLTDYNLTGVVVWEKDNNESKTTEKKQGAFDYGEGYVALNILDCTTAGLMANNLFIGKPESDYVEFDGNVYKITGINMVGQFPDEYVLVKVHFRKELKNG